MTRRERERSRRDEEVAMRPSLHLLCATLLWATGSVMAVPCRGKAFDPEQGVLLRGTVVTMDAGGTILHNGNVLVRSGHIVAIWVGPRAPRGTPTGDPVTIDLGPHGLIFPGLINLHDHPSFNALPLWLLPSSHVHAFLGRPLGTEPYANRYQWNAAPEYRRLVVNPALLLTSGIGLRLSRAVSKFSKVRALLGGETADQGDSVHVDILIRTVDHENFGRDHVESWVPAIDSLSSGSAVALLGRMQDGRVDAWLVHLAEGVRDGQRRPGDAFSSRSEFATLISKDLLTDMTVIVHGNGLEPEDFDAMRAASSNRAQGGDGLGAKLVWSPLSNLALYGRTALVYHALASGVLVSLGTDWSPSGSRTLLDELKIADLTLRDDRLLGADRELLPAFAIAGRTSEEVEAAERALDEELVRMVTSNPARTLRWDREVGSIEVGKVADLLVITAPTHPSAENLPNSPYRNLIDATERDVRLVLVGGEPLAGDPWIMESLKRDDFEILPSTSGGFDKAVDVTKPGVPQGTETFAMFSDSLRLGLAAMGGDHPPAGGGTAGNTNTYSYLKSHVYYPGASSMPNAVFRGLLLQFFGVDQNHRLNIEGIQLSPVLIEDDDFYFHDLEGDVDPGTGLISDATPPFGLYLANFNQVQPDGNPFEAALYRGRYYSDVVMNAAASRAIPVEPIQTVSLEPRIAPSPLTRGGLLTFMNSVRGPVGVALFDAQGRQVRTLLDEPGCAPGDHRVPVDGLDQQGHALRSGLYFYRVETPRKAWQGRLVILCLLGATIAASEISAIPNRRSMCGPASLRHG